MSTLMLGGTEISVLAVGYAAQMRDAIELSDKGNFAVQTIPVGGGVIDFDGTMLEQKTFYWQNMAGRSAEDITKDILDALERKPDVIMLAPRPAWEVYPESVRNAITEAVKNGAVLFLWFAPENVSRYFQGELQPWQVQPFCFAQVAPSDNLVGEFYKFGSGLVNVRKQCCHHSVGWFSPMVESKSEHDYYFTAMAALIESAVRPDINPVKEFKFSDDKYILESEKNEQFQMTIFDFHHDEISTLTIGNGTGQMPELPAGRYSVILQTTDGRNVAGGWYQCMDERGTFQATLDKKCYQSGEKFRLTLDRQGEYRVTVKDNYQRLLAVYHETADAITGTIPGNSKSVINFVRIEKICDNRCVGVQEIEFTLPANAAQQDFYFLVWGSAAPSVRHLELSRKYTELGVDGISATSRGSARAVALCNLLNIPQAANFHNARLTDLLDEAWLASAAKAGEEFALENVPYGAFGFTLGDENYLNIDPGERFPADERVWQAFRVWLKSRYGNITTLNQIWQRDFRDFDSVSFASENEMFSFEHPAAWLDFRAFAAETFAGTQKKIAAEIKRNAPDAYVGWEGGEQFSCYDGYDYADYAAGFNLTNVYARYFEAGSLPVKIFNGHCLRSFKQENALSGFWMNGINYPVGLSHTVWLACLSGFNSIWWWHGIFPDHECAILKPDMSVGHAFSVVADTVAQVKAGPASMLRHAIPERPDVAVYYSALNWQATNLSGSIGSHINNLGTDPAWSIANPAVFANRAQDAQLWAGGNCAGNYAVAAQNMITLLKDLNLDFRMISPRQILSGELNKYRILVLPFVEALSDEEASLIKQFVENGGILLADYRTGIRDGFGNFRESGVLDPVFGIKQQKPFAFCRKNQTIVVNKPTGDGIRAFRLPISFVQNNLERDSAIPAGVDESASPVFYYNSCGKGKTLYFGCDFYQYFQLRSSNQEDKIRDFIQESLVRHLEYPAYKVVLGEYGKPLPATSVFRFTDGEVHYTGIMQDYFAGHPAPFTACIPLRNKGYIYEITESKHYGYGDSVKLSFQPGQPRIVAVFPYQIPPLEITGKTEIFPGETLNVNLHLPSENAQSHTVKITVFDPLNRKSELYSSVLYLPKGQGVFSLKTALNDLPGKWRICVREIASGQESVFEFSITLCSPRG